MNLRDIPPTAYPKVALLVTEQIAFRHLDFEEYVSESEFIQYVNFIRHRVVRLIINVVSSDEEGITQLINGLLIRYSNGELDSHGAAYGLYILGAHAEAAKLVEKEFEKRNILLANRIQAIKSQLHAARAENVLNNILRSYLSSISLDIAFSTRVKSSGSLFAKLISTGSFDLRQLINIQPDDVRPAHMPYDLVGGGIVIPINEENVFKAFTARLMKHFASLGMPLTDQQVYSPGWINRKSLVGSLNVENSLVPFQLHVWDTKANRYEFMSYGNYKMNKLFCPVIRGWSSYLDKDLKVWEHAALVIQSLREQVNC